MQSLHAQAAIKAPIQRCFDIVRSIDAHEDTSTLISGKAIQGKTSGLSELGDETTWSAKFYTLRFKVRTRVSELEPPSSILEERVSGLLHRFTHRYYLSSQKGITTISDTFEIGLPGGVLGDIILKACLIKTLTKVQQHRLNSIKTICESNDWKKYIPERPSSPLSRN